MICTLKHASKKRTEKYEQIDTEDAKTKKRMKKIQHPSKAHRILRILALCLPAFGFGSLFDFVKSTLIVRVKNY